jgi:UDP-N-acetylmuramate: L-alanyl-gamma-D-glutamyl-meso-diaminopimelate ligase
MGPLAGLLVAMGHEVTGSDVAFDPPIGPRLREWGVRCFQGFDAQHLADGPDLVVVGNLCRANNVEARFAIDSGLEYTHIGGALQRFVLPGTRPLVVTGTHGKTTTSALAAGLLEAVGLAPGYLIGGVPHGLTNSFRPPSGSSPSKRGEFRRPDLARASKFPDLDGSETSTSSTLVPSIPRHRGTSAVRSLLRQNAAPAFVIEGDEYDSAFFEKTAKFLHYAAQVVVLTSIEHDHIDIYPTLAEYVLPFERLVSGLPEAGLVVANAADERVVQTVQRHARVPVVWYALEGQETFGVAPHWLVAPGAADASGTEFDLFLGGVAAGRWATPLWGRHNLANAAAAMAAVTHGYGVDPMRLRGALVNLRGVARRQELLGTPDGVFVYDDFAHHPSAVRETLLALRTRHASGRLFVVFEPRSATACRNLHQEIYPESLAYADSVLLARVARDLPDAERLDIARVVSDLRQRGTPAEHFGSVDEIVNALCQQAQRGDVVAVLSNGTFGGIHAKLLAALERRGTPGS